MGNTKEIKFKNYISLVLYLLVVVGATYLLVYKVSFLPNGFDLVSQQKDTISVKTFNILGIEEDILTSSFSQENTWKINDIAYEINRQKEFLWLLLSAVSLFIYLYLSKLLKRMKISYAVLACNFIIGTLLPLYIIINSINRIYILLS